MRPDHYTNGDDGAGSDGGESSGEAAAEADELSLEDAGAPARALAALNALRKSRQHYDVVLVGGGAEVAAHRAVLAAASPYLLEALAPPDAAAAAPPYRVEEVDGDALRALVEYAYTGRLSVRSAAAARRLYRAAWRLRLEAVRAHLADRLLRRLRPADCLEVRALPGLKPDQLAQLDAYVADNFEEVCSSGALAALPQVRIEVMREGSVGGGGGGASLAETPAIVADAALAWLRAQAPSERDLSELCSRAHLVYVDARGALRDCGELPRSPDDAPELQQYRREAGDRRRAPPAGVPPATPAPRAPPSPAMQLGARTDKAECSVLAARGSAGGGTRALLAVRGRLVAARAKWSSAAGGAGAGRASLAGAGAGAGGGGARLAAGRCAGGAAAPGGRLLACGGYDRARVLRDAEWWDETRREWLPAPPMRRERARFATVTLEDTVYVIGGSDGHSELDSVDAFEAAGGWRAASRLPAALAHAAAAASDGGGDGGDGGALYVAGGWCAGGYLRKAWRYSPRDDLWTEAPELNTGRAQCGGAWWQGAVWVLGGCDAWHCLASTERLAVGRGAGAWEWEVGPALPTARRSVGAAEWRGRLVAAGGSDGATSLRRTDWLEPHWHRSAETPEQGAWCAGPLLRRARAGPGLAVLRDVVYAVGGFDGKEFLACAEYLSAADGEWTALGAAPRPPAPVGAGAGVHEPGECSEADNGPTKQKQASDPTPSPAPPASPAH